ncbi:MAG: glutathione S-transferase [Gammaproteobacteria bacterium]|nr:MAG: glutathione S-transferase [Chloroflexota bacterium]TDJ22440.1 MAG: glutathione S-transferase [Gammaproteobacteria bacterium]TDJ40766.1 MAG: glutathione S-transferase [Gammaproteobacteria bacterium]
MITLYGRRSSCNVQKAMWVLNELDVAHEHIELGGDFGGLDAPEFLAMNPHGRVPVLRDDDVVVTESDAIVRYVAACYGEGVLWPTDPAQRAAIDQWLGWTTTTLQPPWIELFWRLVRTPVEKQNPKLIARLTAASIAQFQSLEAQLVHHAYIAGEAFSLADIPAGMTLYRWFEMEIDRPAMRHVERWYEALQERPAYQASICIPFPELVGKLEY